LPHDQPPSSSASSAKGERIVDLVFAGEPAGRRRRLTIGGAAVVSLYAGVFFLMTRLGSAGPTLGAELAARVHDAIAAERAVDFRPPPPGTAPVAAPPVAARTAPAVHLRSKAVPTHPAPAAPAQAGRLAATSGAPVDFTGTAFVVGSGAASYAGAMIAAAGTSRAPAFGTVAPGGTGDGAGRSRARAVGLDEAAWSCAWPAEADARQVDQETVVLRVAVRADGRADRVDIVDDPGFGFGRAARQCALGTRFEPARDRAGAPIAALSPPIRVHFFR
jgi:periplasmic protein TonB